MQWRYRSVVVVLTMLCPTTLWAESSPVPSIVLYDGAVAGEKNELREIARQFANPERMENVPFSDVRRRIEEMIGRQVHIDRETLSDAGFELPDSRQISEWPAGETLVHLLNRFRDKTADGLKLEWIVRDGIATMTTAEMAENVFFTRQYPIAHLISRFGSARELLDAIVASTGVMWDQDEPGTGTLSLVGGVLVVRQTSRGHQSVKQLLAGLAGNDPLVLLEQSEKDLQLLKLLEERIVNLDLENTTLSKYHKQLEELTGERVRLDTHGLGEAGLVEDAPLSARAVNLSLYDAMNLHLRNVNGTHLASVIQNEEILITTGEIIDGIYETRIYRVADLGIMGDRQRHFINMIQSDTDGPWDVDEPGTGTVTPLGTNGVLLIRTTQTVHRQILKLIQERRQNTGLPSVIEAPAAVAASQTAGTPSPAASVSNLNTTGTPTQSDDEYDVPLIVALSLLVGCGVGYGIRYWQTG